MINLEIVSMWQAEVVDVQDDKILYKATTDADTPLEGAIGWGAVLPQQRTLVVVGTAFLFLVGLVINGQNSEPVVFALFGSPLGHKVATPEKP